MKTHSTNDAIIVPVAHLDEIVQRLRNEAQLPTIQWDAQPKQKG